MQSVTNGIFSNQFLALCDELSREDFAVRMRPGEFVARGFADIGYELYAVLPGGKLLSLMTGEQSVPGPSEQEHLFLVPEIDALLNRILELGGKFSQSLVDDGRAWELQGEFPSGVVRGVDESFHAALIRLFIPSSV